LSYKKLKNQVKLYIQKYFWDFEPLIKSYGQISERGWKGHFLWHFQTSSLNFVYNIWLEAWNLKQIFRDEIQLDFSNFFSSISFEKSYSNMTKWGLKFYIKHNFYILTLGGALFWRVIYHMRRRGLFLGGILLEGTN